MLGASVILASCSTVRMSVAAVDVSAKVSTYPTVADLHIASQRMSKTVKWKWNPFNTTPLSTRRGNVKAELIREAGADILVEPEFIQRTSWCNLLGGSLTVTGYPATLDNFRKATPEDLEAMRCANGIECGQYVVVGRDDVNGVIIGKTESPAQTPVQTQTAVQTQTPVQTQTAVQTQTPVQVQTPVQTQTHVNTPVVVHETSSIAAAEPVQVNPAPASSVGTDPVTYDKISTTRFLTTMARDYYGNPDFWPYIYEENNARLGHPDRIKPGTSVRVPSLTKYGVDPNNPADIEKARRLAKEIYARYGKYI